MDSETFTTDHPVIDLQQAEEFLLAMFDDHDWAIIGPADRSRQWVQPSEGCEDFEAKLAKESQLVVHHPLGDVLPAAADLLDVAERDAGP